MIAVCAHFGATLSGTADSIVSTITSGGKWTALADGTAAKKAADSGLLVVGGLKSTELSSPSAHGHVVIVVSGPLDRNAYPTAYWGMLGGVGSKNKTVNYAFNAKDRDHVHYSSTPVTGSLLNLSIA